LKTLSAIIIITFFSAAAFAQAGELDSTFGGDGKVTTSFGGNEESGRSVAIQFDGKIVVAGYSQNDTATLFAVARYDIDGTLDQNFGNGGKVTTQVSTDSCYYYYGYNDWGFAVVIQPDNKIIVAGRTWNHCTTGIDFGIVRYNTNGTLDSSFGSGGRVNTDFNNSIDNAYALALQPDGKIVVAGQYEVHDFAVARYNLDGTLDTTFSDDGKATVQIGGILNISSAKTVAIQSDGKILLGGYTHEEYDLLDSFKFCLVRFNNDGTLDFSFGENARISASIGGNDDICNSIILQADGKIIAVGITHIWGDAAKPAIVRYNNDGSIDSTFGVAGRVIIEQNIDGGEASSVTLQPDAKILLAGDVSVGFDTGFGLFRLNSNGTLDSAFGTNGIVVTQFATSSNANSIALESDGKIVLAGDIDYPPAEFAAARYLSELQLGIINFSSIQSLSIIYPNPIHQTETLEYTLTKNESFTITLYDVNGKLIRNFISNEQRTAGAHKETLNMGALPSGNYVLTLSNGEQKMTVKMVKQ